MKAALLAAFLLPGAGQSAECRQALALGIDVSGSVSTREYSQQINGIAHALRQDTVGRAFLAMPNAPVRLYIYEWSGLFIQTEILPWTEVTSLEDLDRIAAHLERPEARPRQPETAVGLAMLFGSKALTMQENCWRRTLDISADGKSNIGPSPRELKSDPLLDGVTINALVIGVELSMDAAARTDSIPELSAYYQAFVIRGADAFVQVAMGYDDYARAMELKLLRELQVLPVSQIWQDADRQLALH